MTMTYGAILAAGLGTRLRPLTYQCPKPRLPICGRPLLEYGIDLLERANVKGVGVNTHYQASSFLDGFEQRPWSIALSHETELLGTGGGLKRISKLFPNERLIAINGDALVECDLAPVLERHIAAGAAATMVLRRVHKDSPFARVGYDRHHQIYKISEVDAPGVDQHVLRYSAYTGIQIVEPEVLSLVEEKPCDILRTGYRAALARGWTIRADFIDGFWLDVGTPGRYFEANQKLASLDEGARSFWRLPQPGPLSTANSWIHPDVMVEGRSKLGKNVILNRPSILQTGTDLACFVGASSLVVSDAHANAIGYQVDGATQYIELESP